MRLPRFPGFIKLVCTGLIMTALFGGWRAAAANNAAGLAGSTAARVEVSAEVLQIEGTQLFVPMAYQTYNQFHIFGIESNKTLLTGNALMERAKELNASYVRMNHRVSWRDMQPDPGGPILLNLLDNMKDELRALRAAGIRPIVIVDDYPYWATGQASSCAPIQPEYYTAFANFLYVLVNQLKVQEFGVRIWELGNEPDIDLAELDNPNSVFGCWGDKNDQYYGGEAYGEMLKVVAPAIRSADPHAEVWVGGLLLASPESNMHDVGLPEAFLRGILEAGAAPYFDVVPYHWYPSYQGVKIDHDNEVGTQWDAMGGGVLGKANYLRSIMHEYGVEKPVVLNETALGCVGCTPEIINGPFYDMQADFVIRSFTRGISQGISGFMWYTLEGPGWRYTALLDGNNNPKPVFSAYKELIAQLKDAVYLASVSYSPDIEGYIFSRNNVIVEVLWNKSDATTTIQVPVSQFIGLYDRSGTVIQPDEAGGMYQVHVTFSPVFLVKSH
jgi:hypothetical protein